MGFLELWCLNGVSKEVQRGAQGDSLQESGKSGLHVHGDGERVLLLSHGRGIGPQDAPKDSQGLSRVAAGNPGFPGLELVTSGRFSRCL